jgi:hypothetical protein
MGNLQGMSVIQLREQSCAGKGAEGNQEFKNAKFVGCEMFVLSVIEMLREWQKLDPSHAPRICVPRNISSGALTILVHDYIEKTMPWRNQQNDATTSIIGAFKDKWLVGDCFVKDPAVIAVYLGKRKRKAGVVGFRVFRTRPASV